MKKNYRTEKHSGRKILSNILHKAYAIKSGLIRNVILKLIKKIEGEDFYSETLRKIYKSYYGITIGMYSYGGCFSSDNIQPGTEIGRYCSFARNVYIYTRNHPLKHRSTHPFFFNAQLKILDKDIIHRSNVVIGNDVWIGMNAIILPSVSIIGDGAVIGAGSVVTKDVPPFAVVAGNPAKIIKYRFREETIKNILKSAWWNKSIKDLMENIDEFLVPVEDKD